MLMFKALAKWLKLVCSNKDQTSKYKELWTTKPGIYGYKQVRECNMYEHPKHVCNGWLGEPNHAPIKQENKLNVLSCSMESKLHQTRSKVTKQ